MSTLSLRDIQGISAYSNTVRIPTGHNLETYGKLVANGTLKVPVWTTTTRPVSPEVGMIGYNNSNDVRAAEVYTGSDKGWIRLGSSAVVSLSEAVGVTPALHYQSSDLTGVADGTTLSSNNFWINNGYLGRTYDLINDTSAYFSSSIIKTTQNSVPVVQFSGFCGLAFRSAAYITWVAANAYPVYTVAYVYGGASNSTPAINNANTDSSPAFCGSAQGPNTNIPDRVGGGLFGWCFPGYWGNNSNFSTWYDNDGGVDAGGTVGGPAATIGNAVVNQWINRVNTSASVNSMTSWYGKTSSAFTNASHANISIGAGPTYGFTIPISGMGNVRRADASSYTTTGVLYDAVLFREALSDTQVQKLRDYYATKYPYGNVAG